MTFNFADLGDGALVFLEAATQEVQERNWRWLRKAVQREASRRRNPGWHFGGATHTIPMLSMESAAGLVVGLECFARTCRTLSAQMTPGEGIDAVNALSVFLNGLASQIEREYGCTILANVVRNAMTGETK